MICTNSTRISVENSLNIVRLGQGSAFRYPDGQGLPPDVKYLHCHVNVSRGRPKERLTGVDGTYLI
jgi:hypothetical protein